MQQLLAWPKKTRLQLLAAMPYPSDGTT
ncbi:putative DNA primase large subunit, partial [Zea mays]